MVKFGVETFGDITISSHGSVETDSTVINNVIEEARLAEDVGVDIFGIGEHHRNDYAISSPDVVLTAIAAQTHRIELCSAVTVLSSDDPIRVYERFSTLNAISSGRAQIIAGRGSFIESFPLFGFDLADYDRLFEEKIEILAQLCRTGEVSLEGTIRPPLRKQVVYPVSGFPLPLVIGVGGNPESVIRAANYQLPVILAVIGGNPTRFTQLANIYRASFQTKSSHTAHFGLHTIGHIAPTDSQAAEEYFPYWQKHFERIKLERGWNVPITHEMFLKEIGPRGALMVGSPETVASKITSQIKLFKADRFDLKYSTGQLPHSYLMKSIELFGTQVVPLVKDQLSANSPTQSKE